MRRQGPPPGLQDIDLRIELGEIVTIVGPNGGGKTTLLRTITGAMPIDAGQLQRLPHSRIGYVPQELQLDTGIPITVARFLRLPWRRPADEVARTADAMGVASLLDSPMQELAGGQFQRVLLARALLGKPALLLLDEPTRSLDPPGIASFYALIASVREQTGCAVLMVSHDLHVVMRASDRIVCLNGHICCEGTPAAVSSTPEYQALFGSDHAGTLALYRHAHDHVHDAEPPP